MAIGRTLQASITFLTNYQISLVHLKSFHFSYLQSMPSFETNSTFQVLLQKFWINAWHLQHINIVVLHKSKVKLTRIKPINTSTSYTKYFTATKK